MRTPVDILTISAQNCPGCGNPMSRLHRKLHQKLIYSARFWCSICKTRVVWYQPSLHSTMTWFRFVFSFHTCCPRCGKDKLQRLSERDRIDPFSRNPLALFQVILGAPLAKCWLCRLQYYDWRPLRFPSEKE